MKTIIKQTTMLLVFILINTNICISQFNQFNFNTAGRTNPLIQAIVIGNVPFGFLPLSGLHINSGSLSPSANFQQGEVFRTDCPAANNTFWRMFRGGVEQGVLFNNTGSNDVILQASQKGGNLILKDYKNEITLEELIELKKEVQELKALLANKN